MQRTEIHLLGPGTLAQKRALLSKALAHVTGRDFSRVYHIAATRRISEDWVRRAFHASAPECYIPPVALTLRELAKRLTRGVAIMPASLRAPALAALKSSGMGYAALVSDLGAELMEHFPGQDFAALGERITKSLLDRNVAEEALARASEALALLGSYEALLADKSLTDEGRLIERAAEALHKESHKLKIDVLIIDGFFEATPAEERLLTELSILAEHTLVLVPVSGPEDDLEHCITRMPCFRDLPAGYTGREPAEEAAALSYSLEPSKEEELEALARRIKNAYVSGAERGLEDIIVAFPRLTEYRDLVKRVLRGRYGLPINEACLARPRIQEPEWLDLIALLVAIEEDYPRLAFSRLLTSRAFKALPEGLRSKAPSVALNSSMLKGQEAWLTAFKAEGAEIKWLFKILAPLHRARANAPYSRYASLVMEALSQLKFHPHEAALEEARELTASLSLMDEFAAGGTGLRGFTEALRTLLAGRGAYLESPGLEVASLFDLRGLEPRVLYIGGMKDGDLPARQDLDLLLPDSVRRDLGLVDMQRHLRLQEHIFRRLAASASALHMSLPQMEGDKYFLPSLFLSGATQIDRKTPGVFSEAERQRGSWQRPLGSYITGIRGAGGYGREAALRVTEIDAYRDCPRRFFLERVMGLEPTELADYELEARTLGTSIHKVMELLIAARPAGLEEYRTVAAGILDKVLAEAEMDGYFRSLVKESFLARIEDIYLIEDKIREEGYEFHQAEQELKGEPVAGLSLKGKADRLDRREDGRLSILDYKTGGAKIASSDVMKRGRGLQLFLYAALLKLAGQATERVGIYSLKDMKVKWVPNKQDLKKGHDMEALMAEALRLAREAAEGMAEGRYPAEPAEDNLCRSCLEQPYCPYIQRPGHSDSAADEVQA